MILQAVFFVIYVASAVIFVISLVQVNGFLSETKRIDSTADLERFKELARGQMHLALVTLVVLLTGLAVGLFLIREHGLKALAAVIVANGFVFAMGMFHKKVETRARGLPVASEELQREYQRVSESWSKKALPDF